MQIHYHASQRCSADLSPAPKVPAYPDGVGSVQGTCNGR